MTEIQSIKPRLNLNLSIQLPEIKIKAIPKKTKDGKLYVEISCEGIEEVLSSINELKDKIVDIGKKEVKE